MPQPVSPANIDSLPRPRLAVRNGLALAAVLAVVGAVWLIGLPALGQRQAVRMMIDRNERLGINPSAKFYSEVDAVRPARASIRSAGNLAKSAGQSGR